MKTDEQHKEHWLNLIIDRLTGSISEEAEISLREWTDASEENKQYAEKIEQLWESLDIISEEDRFDSEKAFLLFKERVDQETSYADKPERKTKHLSRRKLLSYAAILIPLLLLGYFAHGYYRMKTLLNQNVSLSEVSVPYGSKTQLTLQDGSKVWLNAGSKICYDFNTQKKQRILKLSGEAYLEVAKNKEYPFIVDAGEIKIKVLGTRFNVKAYKDNEKIQVALLQGSIEMKARNNATWKLKPNDIACFDTASKKIRIYQNSRSTENMIGWMNNHLIFNSESFEQIAYTLERHFNVKINIRKESVKKREFIGDFVNNETIEQIFKVMSADGKFNDTIKGSVIDVY